MNFSELKPAFWDHVEELRKTLIYCLITVALTTLVVFLCFGWLYPLIVEPLEDHKSVQKVVLTKERLVNPHNHSVLIPLANKTVTKLEGTASIIDSNLYLPPNSFAEIERETPSLILLGPLEGISATFKLCFWLSCALSSPFWGLLILRFILPGLKTSERSLIFPFVACSLLALLFGLTFSLYIFIPFTNRILLTFNESMGQNLWSVSHYLNYTLMMAISMIIATELFVILFFLVHYGKIRAEAMSRWRPIIYVGLFVLSAFITPPDIITQIALALPMTALYEGAIWYAKIRELILRDVNQVSPI